MQELEFRQRQFIFPCQTSVLFLLDSTDFSEDRFKLLVRKGIVFTAVGDMHYS